MIFEPIIIKKGSGSDFSVPLKVYADEGALITAKLGEIEISGIATSDGEATLYLPSAGDWIVSASLDDKELAPKTVTIAGNYTTFFDFNVPILPDGYVQLAYIETSDEKTYLYTDEKITAPVKTRIVCDVEILSLSTSYKHSWIIAGYFAWGTSTKYYTYYGLRIANGSSLYGTGIYCLMINNSTSTGSGIQVNADGTPRRLNVDWNMPEGYLKINNEEPVSISPPASWTQPVNMGIPFKGNYSAGSRSRIYSYKRYEDGELLENLIPCKNANGTVGMYDIVQEKFYSSQTSSSPFVAGPEV